MNMVRAHIATITKRNNGWSVQIRRKGYPLHSPARAIADFRAAWTAFANPCSAARHTSGDMHG